jgi:mannose-1-phosphate guanylyltransferase/mannose-1-phosphate guanylyltransferase/mannose-6-phosphate isomerase
MIPVIISGGSGTRLWPLSRNSFPKQFCEIFDESLIEKTYSRLKPLGPPHILTINGFRSLSLKFLKPLGLNENELIAEPFGRNTAPAIALLCAEFQKAGLAHEIVGIFPADHFILNDEEFRNCVRQAALLTQNTDIVTIGITPTHPATGYGYIEIDKTRPQYSENILAYNAIGFHEKPNLETAQKFILENKFLWNAGMFVFKVHKMISLFEKHLPQIWNPIKNATKETISEIYTKISSISIDYGIMEKMDSHICGPSTFQWSDVGTWDSIAELLERPEHISSNLKTNLYETHGNNNFFVSSTEKTVGFVGVSDLIVVNTDDATLICARGSTEKVKNLLDQIHNNTIKNQHTFEIRPWGKFEILKETDEFKSKIITVDIGAQISYQSHSQRKEYWTIIKGTGKVILNETATLVKKGSTIHIPINCKHRIINSGLEPLVFIEVQLGSYFGEDDIVRYKDEYGR